MFNLGSLFIFYLIQNVYLINVIIATSKIIFAFGGLIKKEVMSSMYLLVMKIAQY